MPTLCVSFGTSSSSSVGWLVEKEQCFYEDADVKFATGNVESFANQNFLNRVHFVRLSVFPSFRLSVCPSVRLSVGWSVTNVDFLNVTLEVLWSSLVLCDWLQCL